MIYCHSRIYYMYDIHTSIRTLCIPHTHTHTYIHIYTHTHAHTQLIMKGCYNKNKVCVASNCHAQPDISKFHFCCCTGMFCNNNMTFSDYLAPDKIPVHSSTRLYILRLYLPIIYSSFVI